MRYRISEIKISPEKVAAEGGGISHEKLTAELKRQLAKTVARKAGKVKITDVSIIRESVDARKKPDVKLVYTLDFSSDRKLPFAEATSVEYRIEDVTGVSSFNENDMEGPRPVIAGFGPCGIFAALILAEAGLRPIVLERGKCVEDRVADVKKFWKQAEEGNEQSALDPESNVQFGEGGAGTFSDGKLTTGIKDIRIRKVLEEFVKAGAPEEILYKHKPHIGTDKLRQVVKNLRHHIEEMGGEIRFGTRLDDIVISDGRLTAVRTAEGELIGTQNLIMAMGHSARDTFKMLYEKGFDMKQKPFSIGVRIEHPQEMINRSQYGNEELAYILGPAEYKLNYRCAEDAPSHIAGRGVYTFCMCPGGEVVNASTEAGTSVTNGMSNSARDGLTANSALLVDVRTTDFTGGEGIEPEHPLAGIEFQKKYEELAWENRGQCGMARTDYLNFRSSDENCVRKSLPAFASEAIIEAMPHLARRLSGFDNDLAVLTAVETRSSSPVRILRDENMDATVNGSAVKGVIPAGEGPGFAGGIMSAAVDGIRAAEVVIKHIY